MAVTNHAPPEMNESVCHLSDMGVAATIATGIVKDVGPKTRGDPSPTLT
jgi:hypothetical protein